MWKLGKKFHLDSLPYPFFLLVLAFSFFSAFLQHSITYELAILQFYSIQLSMSCDAMVKFCSCHRCCSCCCCWVVVFIRLCLSKPAINQPTPLRVFWKALTLFFVRFASYKFYPYHFLPVERNNIWKELWLNPCLHAMPRSAVSCSVCPWRKIYLYWNKLSKNCQAVLLHSNIIFNRGPMKRAIRKHRKPSQTIDFILGPIVFAKSLP